MNADDPRAKWHSVDENAANVLIMGSSTPGVVYPISTNALPSQIQQMTGVVSYFASNYVTPVVLANNATAGGEMAVVRTDGSLGKAYNFIFATSSNGQVVYNGPHYYFDQHHFASSAPVPVETMFGHVPLSTKSKP